MRTVFSDLSEKWNLPYAVAGVLDPEETFIEMRFHAPDLQDEVWKVLEVTQLSGFASKDAIKTEPAYACLSLTYNPDVPGDPYKATLGDIHRPMQQIKYVKDDVKNSYYDTYGFWMLTPALRALRSIISRCKRSLVRSRLAVIRGNRPEARDFNFGWHRDEPVFENLRVNIPVFAPPGYGIQVELSGNHPKEGSPSIETYKLKEGFAYSWQTGLAHRACALEDTKKDRVNLVLGFAPWFDNVGGGKWEPNEFFGRKHPFTMLRDGDVIAW
jgi:hypothetical protein